MSKAKSAAVGLAAVQVSAEWSVELFGFRDVEHGTWNYYINIMYTIDTMVKHRSAKRATKRSAKRAAKRGAYKSKKTHRKMKLSRKRMQRGGVGFDDIAANLLARSTGIAVTTLVILIKTVQSLKTMFQIVRTIAEISKIVSEEKKADMKTKLNKQIEALKDNMSEYLANNPELASCIKTLQNKGQTGDVVVQEPLPTDVGKTCVFNEDQKPFQALVVGDRTDEEGNHVLDLWLNGAGIDPKTIQYDKVSSGVVNFVDKNDPLFLAASDNKYGQSPVTIEDARKVYEIPASGAVDEPQSSPEEEEKSIFSKLTDLFTNLRYSTDKKQTLLDMISGFKVRALSNLDRVSNRFDDPELKNCITQIKNALTAKIREQLERLKGSTSSQVPGGEMSQPSGPSAVPVPATNTGFLGKFGAGLGNFTKSLSDFGSSSRS